MATDNFSWKGLFLNEEDENEPQKQQPRKESSNTKKKSNITSFPNNNDSLPSGVVDQNILNSVIEMYEKGFDSLNQPGYDFYEFFKAIMAIDPNNNQAYTMAYTMAQSMDKGLSKEKLLSKANFYITEIEKVHKNYQNQGTLKKNEISQAQKKEKSDLNSEVLTLQAQLLKLQKELENKTNLLNKVDSKYAHKVAETEDKLLANNIAKDTILGAIQKVISGIKSNI